LDRRPGTRDERVLASLTAVVARADLRRGQLEVRELARRLASAPGYARPRIAGDAVLDDDGDDPSGAVPSKASPRSRAAETERRFRESKYNEEITMNKFAAAMLSALMFSACAPRKKAVSKFVSDKVRLKAGGWLRVVGDKGLIEVVPIASGPITYEVEFRPDQGAAPSQKDYDDSSATFGAAEGLTVRSGEHLEIRMKIRVPANQPVQAQLETGELVIGRLTGKIDATLVTGELRYDARALPADSCVTASVNEGIVTNKRDFRCKPGDAILHVRTGTLEVE
jgi:hypothetical protein